MGGEISFDLGALRLSAMESHIGLTDRLTTTITDLCHPGYIKHTLRDLLTQRTFQVTSGYGDGSNSNTLHRGPLFKPTAECAPLDTNNGQLRTGI